MAAVSRHYRVNVVLSPEARADVSLAWLGNRLSVERLAGGELAIR